MKPKKAIAVLTIIIATVAVATVIPYAAAETGGNQLEFTNLYPASLAYDIGEEVAIICRVHNIGTEDVDEVAITFNILDPNGTLAEMKDRDIGVIEAGAKSRSLNLGIWTVDENATSGKYTVDVILRWGSEAIEKTTFFYVPIEIPPSTPELVITAAYTSRLSYNPGEQVECICKIKNVGTEDVEGYYVSLCLFDQNGTLFASMCSNIDSLDADKERMHILKGLDVPIDAEPGNYTMESIVWWGDEAVSKTSGFKVT